MLFVRATQPRPLLWQLLLLVAVSCSERGALEPPCPLGHATAQDQPDRSFPATAPRLGAVAQGVPIYGRPAREGTPLGWLRAGATLARSEDTVGNEGCREGWYAVAPRGYVCGGAGATLDLSHPTILAMALGPRRDQSLPYPYATTHRNTPLFRPDPRERDAVMPLGKLAKQSTMAVVGSWEAFSSLDQPEELALLTSGEFVRRSDIHRAVEPAPASLVLGTANPVLPLAFVLREGASSYHIRQDSLVSASTLRAGTFLPLVGRPRMLGDSRLFATTENTWVREPEVAVLSARNDFPEGITPDTHWADVDLGTGAIILYAGKTARMALVARAMASGDQWRGQAHVRKKEITRLVRDALAVLPDHSAYDLAWVLELDNGVVLHGALWERPFGSLSNSARIELGCAEAHQVWEWLGPELPEGWHGVSDSSSPGSLVMLR